MQALLDSDAELSVIHLPPDPHDVICSCHGEGESMFCANIHLHRELHDYARQMQGHDQFSEGR